MLLGFLAYIIVGVIAGLIAGVLRKGHGHRILTYMIVAVVGSILGGFLASGLDLTTYGFRVSIVTSLAASAIALLVYEGFVGEKTTYHHPEPPVTKF